MKLVKKTLLAFAMLVFTVSLCFPDYVGRLHRKLGGERYVDRQEFYRKILWQHYSNRNQTIDDSTIVFFGDSRINSVSVESHFNAVNYGISGETLQTALKEIPKFGNLEGKTIVLGYGINDNHRSPQDIFQQFVSLVDSLKQSNVMVLKVLPTNGKLDQFNNDKVLVLNSMLETLPNFIEINGLEEDGLLIHTYDGVHLDEVGKKIFISELKKRL